MVNGTEIKPTQNELSPSDFVRGRGERGLSALSLFRILTAIYFALRLPWLLTLPVSEAPDEPNHFWVCHFLSTHFTLPTAQQVFAGGTPAEYGSLPPFGYLPHALISACFPEQMMPFVSRFGSLLAGLPAVWAAFAIGREIFPRTSLAALALPLLIVVQPQLVFVNSYTNTDSTTTSLTSIAILLVVLAIKRGLSMWQAVVAGFLLGWTALSKHTGLCIVPALGVGLLAAAFVHRDSVKSAAKKLGALAVVFLLTSAWWFVRNYHEFSGDWLGSKTMYETWAKILPRHNGQIVHPWPPVSQIGWWRYVFFDYWGLFGYMDRYLWRPIYIAYLGFVIASVIGWFKHSSWKRAHFRAGAAQTSVPAEGSGEHNSASTLTQPNFQPDPGALPTEGSARPSSATTLTQATFKPDPAHGAVPKPNSASTLTQPYARMIWIVFALCPLFSLVAMVSATLANVTGPHGRYLFPSIVPLTALLIEGYYRLGPRAGRAFTIMLIVLNLAVTIGAWVVFYPPK